MNTTEQHDETRQGEALVLEGTTGRKKLYLESYGCQMNFSDSEIVASLLQKEGYETTNKPEEADLVLLNTCSIRDKAEQTVRKRLDQFNTIKAKNPELKVGVLGCMAERVREKFFEEEKLVDLVVGPDAYRDLPNLLEDLDGGRKAVNVLLSKEETYDDIEPVRLGVMESALLCPLPAVATTCARSAWFHLPADANAAAIRKRLWTKYAVFGKRDTKRLPYWVRTSIRICGTGAG